MKDSFDANRRLYVRVQFQDPVQVRPINPAFTYPGWYLLAEDISEGGLRLSAPAIFAVGARLRLDIEAANGAVHVCAIGEVVWVTQVRYQDRWDIGIAFVEMGDSDRERLRKLIADRRNDDSPSEHQ